MFNLLHSIKFSVFTENLMFKFARLKKQMFMISKCKILLLPVSFYRFVALPPPFIPLYTLLAVVF